MKNSNFKYKSLYFLFAYLISFILTAKYQNEKEIKSRISDINVLLPICESSNCNPVSYEIEAFGGCYEWKVDKPEYIDLELIDFQTDSQDCYSKVRISPKNIFDTNTVVFIQAKDKNSNELFKCRIGFGKIKNLKIMKRFDVINVGDIVEMDVKGFDEKGNAFSSLEGFRFEWKISKNDLIEIIKNDQIKKQGEKRIEVEKKYQSDIINLKGISTGKISLEAEIIEESLKGLKTKTRNLYIIQPFLIFPEEPLYILYKNTFNFDLKLEVRHLFNQEINGLKNIKNKGFENADIDQKNIYLNSRSFLKFVEFKNRKFYNWGTEDKSCGEVIDFGQFSSLKRNCLTKIFAIDNRIDEFNRAENLVHVVEPTSLELGVYELTAIDLEKISKNFSKGENKQNLKEKIIEDKIIDYDKLLTNTNSYKFSSIWKLVAGKFYLIKNILMFERHPIYFNSNDIQFNISFEKFGGYVKEIKCFRNNMLCVIDTEKANIYSDETGKIIIENRENILDSKVFYSYLGNDKKNEYNVSKNIQIYNKIQIKNFGQKRFYLPYLGFKNYTTLKSDSEIGLLEQELHLIVKGGSFKYRYFSSDRNVIDIRDGILFGRNLGISIITVKDDEIENNIDTIEVEVKEIKEINYLQERQEILIGKSFFVGPVANAGYEVNKENPTIFTNCTNLNLEPSLSFKNRNIKTVKLEDLISDSNSKYSKYYFSIKPNENSDSTIFAKSKKKLSENIKKNIFFGSNKNLLNCKMKSLGLNNDIKDVNFVEYLDYTHYGVCKLFGFNSNEEGHIKMSFSSPVQTHEGKINKIISNLITKIYVYTPLVLNYPIITDNFTKELNSRTIFPNFENRISRIFLLAHGSSVNLKLSGGIEKWPEFSYDYQENQFVFDEKNNRTFPLDSLKNLLTFSGSDKSFKYECTRKKQLNENKDYEINISIKNKADKTLIKPAETSIRVVIGCQEPKHLSIYFLGLGFSNFNSDNNYSKNSDALFNNTFFSNVTVNLVGNQDSESVLIIPQKRDIEYFEQKGSFDGLRVYSFDENKRMIYNFSSYQGDVEYRRAAPVRQMKNKEENLIQIYTEHQIIQLMEDFKSEDKNIIDKLKNFNINLNDFEKILKMEKISINHEYLYFTIYFFNLIQNFELTYNLNNGVSQTAKINVIDIPKFSPNNSTIYLIEKNEIFLDVLYGSGDFEFSVNNNELANYEYSFVDRKIKITALNPGVLTITIKDKKIGIDHKSVAIIYISPIKKIELIGGGLLMVNDTAKVEMKVYNIYDHVFPVEQVRKMNLSIDKNTFIKKGIIIKSSETDYFTDKEKDGLKNKMKESIIQQYEIESAFDTSDKDSETINVSKYFYIKGIIPDLYSISIIKDFPRDPKSIEINLSKSDLNDPNLKYIFRSNYVKIEVFRKLDIYPPSLLMVPGSVYTLSIKGGPSNEKMIVKKYEIVNPDIASVELNEPQVKALLVGQTILRITISIKEENSEENNDSIDILTVKEVPIQVDFPDTVDVIGAYNRKIYTKSTIRLFAALKLGKKTFTYAYGPIKYTWTVDNSLIANLKYFQKDSCGKNVNQDNQNSNAPALTCKADNNLIKVFNSLGAFLKTYKQGISEVKVKVEILYPETYSTKKPNIFVKSEKILIDDNLFVDIAEFYEKNPNKSGLYLVPYNVDHDLVTNKNKNELKYSLVSQHCKSNDPVLNLKENGRITTFDRKGLAYIMIEKKVIDNKPFMPLVLPIYVVDYYSIFVERSYQTIDTEIGQSITLRILIQHEYGILFAEKFERFEIRIEISNPRVAQIELLDNNSIIRINGNMKGQANIILMDPESNKIYDVFNINVFPSVILPEIIVLNIGGEVDFLKKDEEKKMNMIRDAEWIVDDPNVFRLDEITGKGFALSEGTTKIHLVTKDLRKEKLVTNVIVGSIKKIKPNSSLISNYLTDVKNDPFYKKEYLIPLKFFIDENGSIELSEDLEDELNIINHKMILKCISEQPEIFDAQVRDLSNEDSLDVSHSKKLCVVTLKQIPFDVVSPNELLMKVIVESQGRYKKDKIISHSTINLPFVSSIKIKDDFRVLAISKENRTQLVEIDNIDNIIVEVKNPQLLLVHLVKEGKNYIRFFVPHTVRENFENNTVKIINKLTGQQMIIDVSFSNEKSEGFMGIISREYIVDFFTALIIFLVIYVLIIHNYSNQNNNERNVPPPSQAFQGQKPKSDFNFNNKSR